MNIRDFKYLIAIDEIKNFIQAAKKCHISQPALSQQINKIENNLGFKIFERNKKNIITTSKGKEVIKYAKMIIKLNNKIKDVAHNDLKIKIGLIPTICPYLLPKIIYKLKSEFLDIKFYFSELKSIELIDNIKSGALDIGIIAYFKEFIDNDISYHKLYDEEFFLTLNKNSTLKENDFENILKQKKLILLEEGNCITDNIKDICSIYKESNFNNFYATNIETVKNMIKIDNGIGLLPKFSIENDDQLKKIAFSSKRYREIGMVIRKNNSIDSDFVNKFIKILKNL